MVLPFLVKEGIIIEAQQLDMEWLSKSVNTLKERAKTLVELANSLKCYILEYVEIDPKAKEKFLKPENVKHLSELKELLAGLSDFTAAEIEKIFHSYAEKHGLKLGSIAQPVRVAITGSTASPGLFEVLEIVGKNKALKRLAKAIEK